MRKAERSLRGRDGPAATALPCVVNAYYVLSRCALTLHSTERPVLSVIEMQAVEVATAPSTVSEHRADTFAFLSCRICALSWVQFSGWYWESLGTRRLTRDPEP